MKGDLSQAAVERALQGDLGADLRVLQVTESTQRDALEWEREGAPHGALVVTDHQRAGRGRWGRGWVSEPGESLQFSLVLRPELPALQAGLLTTAIGIGVAEGVAEVSGLPTRLKWPNDVTVRGRKLAGILLESRVAAGMIDAAVAGVGVNVGWSCAELPPAIAERATSVACELERIGGGPGPGRAELLGAVLRRVESAYAMAVHPAGAREIMKRATAMSDVIGRRVRVTLANGARVEGEAVRLLPSGALEVTSGGEVDAFEAGEVEHIRGS